MDKVEEKRKELDKLREERRKIGKAVMEANKTGNSSEYAILRTESVRLDNEIKKMEDELKEQESTITPEEAEIKSLEEQLAKKRELQQRAKENGAYEQEAQLESEANEIVRAIRELKDKTKEPENTVTPEEAEIKSLEEQLAKKRELQQRAKENGAYEQEAQLESEANEIIRAIRELKDKSKEQENPTTDEMAKLQEKLKLLKEEENEYIGAYYIPKELTDEIKQIEEEISKLKDNLIEKDVATIENGTGTIEGSTITVEEEEPTLNYVDNSSIGEEGFKAPSSIDNSDGFRAPGSIYDSDNPRSSNFGLDGDTSLDDGLDFGLDDDTSLGSRTDLGRDIPLSGNNIFKRIPVTEDIIIPVDNTQTIENPTQPEPTQTQTSDEINKINDEIKKLEESIDKIMESDAINDEDKKRLIIEVRKQISEKHKERAEAIENNEQDRQDPIQGSGEGRPGTPDAPHENKNPDNLPELTAGDKAIVVLDKLFNHTDNMPEIKTKHGMPYNVWIKGLISTAGTIGGIAVGATMFPLGIPTALAALGGTALGVLAEKKVLPMLTGNNKLNKELKESIKGLNEKDFNDLVDGLDSEAILDNMPHQALLNSLQEVIQEKMDDFSDNAKLEEINEKQMKYYNKNKALEQRLNDPTTPDSEKQQIQEEIKMNTQLLDRDRKEYDNKKMQLEAQSKKLADIMKGNIYKSGERVGNVGKGKWFKGWNRRRNIKSKDYKEPIEKLAEGSKVVIEGYKNDDSMKIVEGKQMKDKVYEEYGNAAKSYKRRIFNKREGEVKLASKTLEQDKANVKPAIAKSIAIMAALGLIKDPNLIKLQNQAKNLDSSINDDMGSKAANSLGGMENRAADYDNTRQFLSQDGGLADPNYISKDDAINNLTDANAPKLTGISRIKTDLSSVCSSLKDYFTGTNAHGNPQSQAIGGGHQGEMDMNSLGDRNAVSKLFEQISNFVNNANSLKTSVMNFKPSDFKFWVMGQELLTSIVRGRNPEKGIKKTVEQTKSRDEKEDERDNI